jgi:hypothetical protein
MQETITNTQINSVLSFTQMFKMASLHISPCSKDLPTQQCSMFKAYYNHFWIVYKMNITSKKVISMDYTTFHIN